MSVDHDDCYLPLMLKKCYRPMLRAIKKLTVTFEECNIQLISFRTSKTTAEFIPRHVMTKRKNICFFIQF